MRYLASAILVLVAVFQPFQFGIIQHEHERVAVIEVSTANAVGVIAFGGATAGAHGSTGTSFTYTTVSVSGSNTYGVDCIKTDKMTDTISTVVWNGSSLTEQGARLRADGNGFWSCWGGLIAAGNSITITASVSTAINSIEMYYTGVGATDAATPVINSGSGTSITTSITPVTTGAWAILGADAKDTPGSGVQAGTGATKRVADNNDHNMFDNNAAITPPAATSETVTQTLPEAFATVMFAIDPSTGGVVFVPWQLFAF